MANGTNRANIANIANGANRDNTANGENRANGADGANRTITVKGANRANTSYRWMETGSYLEDWGNYLQQTCQIIIHSHDSDRISVNLDLNKCLNRSFTIF